MRQTLILLIILIVVLSNKLSGQVSPSEMRELNYRLVGFSFPQTQRTDKYVIEIANGIFNNELEFKKHINKTNSTKSNRTIVEVPQWGALYTWRFTCYSKGIVVSKSALYHFRTGYIPAIDTHSSRLTILKKASKYTGATLFCDKTRVLYDLNGKALWYLPNLPGMVSDHAEVRDMKLTPRGTITFVTNNKAYEINYNCELLWEPPDDGKVSGDSIERYHHELTMLSNGNYMVLGNELVAWEWVKNAAGDSSLNMVPAEQLKNNVKGKNYPRISFGTIIEYDTTGKVIWSWKSSAYFKQTALLHNNTVKSIFDSHENAFYFDEERKNVFVSFKNFSQLIKIKYPEGIVSNVYGNLSDTNALNNTLFCHQHGCKVSKKGYPYLFNNNICHPEKTPTVVLMEEPASGKRNLKKIWEYIYPYKGDFTELRKYEGTSGGNVIELNGGEMFVSMCNPYGNIFIVTKDKKLLWDAFIEQYNTEKKVWERKSSYRASIISSRLNLEHLVWGENTTVN